MIEYIHKVVAPLRRRILNMIRRGIVNVINDKTMLQSLQVTGFNGEVLGDLERLQQYGFTSHPLPGSEAILLSVGGMRQHTVIGAVEDRRYRVLNLDEGDVCLYTNLDEENNLHRITLKRNRVCEIECDEIRLVAGGSTVIINAAGIDIDGRE